MDEEPRYSNRARRALPLISAALTAAIVASLIYLISGTRPPPAPAASRPIAIMSGPYTATYYFINPSVGWSLVLDNSSFSTSMRIFVTTDGATHWQLQYTGQAEGGQAYLQFFDRQNGFAYAGLLYRTVDGGSHWQQVQAPGYVSTFASPTLGWSLGSPEDVVYSTADGGITWKQMGNVPGAAFFFPYGESPSPRFRETGEGWLGAGYLESPLVYLTVDGAATWRAVAIPFPSSGQRPRYATTVSVAPGGQVLVLVRDETILRGAYTSDDLGKSWRAVTLPPTISTFSDLSFVDALHWIALRAGYVSRTEDAGASWTSVQVSGLPEDWRYIEAHAIDADHAWWSMVATSRPTDSALAMTSDGGLHWKTVNVPKPT